MRKIISIGIMCMFLLLFTYPAVAEDVYNTQVRQSEYEIAWGNGQDDDGDGVIDNWEEEDVINGTRTVDPNNTTSTTWYQNFTQPNSLERGVFFDAVIDEIIEIKSNDNISVSPTQSCYYLNLDYFDYNFAGYDTVDNVLNVATFYMNLSPTDIMNGAQEMWYRSPLVWNDEDNSYESHYLNVYNSDNELVYASVNDTNSMPKPKYVEDDSALNGIGGERVYYKLDMNFRTEEKYRFEEYVEITDDNPINSVKLYSARAQDIGDDGLTDTYVFKGTDYGRKIPIESSWSAVFTTGIGRAGTESVLYSNENYSYTGMKPTIYTNRFEGDPDIDDTGSATFIFPIRTTMPLNVSISYRVWSGSSYQSWISPVDSNTAVIRDATGTLIFTINISDPDPTEPNEYQLSFTLLNFNESNNAMTYTMYPEVGSTHSIQYGVGDNNATIKHFATHIEIANEQTAAASEETADSTIDLPKFLLGIGLIVAGVVLSALIISAPVGVPLIVSGIGVVAVGALTLVGSSFVFESVGFGEGTLIDFLSDGAIRGVSGIISGVESIAGAAWELLLNAWEIIKDLGNAVIYWAGIIFEAVAEIIWLIAFLAVIWIWSRFLDIMKYITMGEPEKALTSIGTTATKATSGVKRVTRPVKKTATKTSRWYTKRRK
jgi:hypothetical protein